MTHCPEKQFHQEMRSLYTKTGRANGYWPKRFLQKVKKDGGLAAAKQWLKPEQGLSSGLQKLARKGRIDLSMEALVLKEPWCSFFSQEELNEAKNRLTVAGRISRG